MTVAPGDHMHASIAEAVAGDADALLRTAPGLRRKAARLAAAKVLVATGITREAEML
ncbi:MAG TPA: hypothetical protein VLC49_13790 [Solirubrobacteraceae bacterium]|nr:hypothetical protein [Solirubrobacteraceae bacterium]